MKQHTKYFILGFTLALLSSTAWSTASKWTQEAVTQAKVTKHGHTVSKLKAFYKKQNARLWDNLATEMAEATLNASTTYEVPLSIQVGVNVTESELHPFAVSKTGAKGMGQVDFVANKEELGEGNPFEPSYNQLCSAYLLKQKISQYGVNKGLEIYNVGEGNYARGVRNKKYVAHVLSNATKFKQFKQ